MENIIVALILLGIFAGILWYFARAKKRGETCIACPYAKQCRAKCGGEGSFSSNTGGEKELKV